MKTVTLSKVTLDFGGLSEDDPGVGGFAVTDPDGIVIATYHSHRMEPARALARALAKDMGPGYECCVIVEG